MDSNRKDDLEFWLGEVTVSQICVHDESFTSQYPQHMQDWFLVETEEAVTGFFFFERDALRFRLDYINQKLNGIK